MAEPQPQLAYRAHDGDGPPALLIHGYLTGAVYWNTNLPALRTVCSPVVIDLWGHGDSPSPDDPAHYRPAGLVAAFERLRAALGHDTWFVGGHSLGTALALHYAIANPKRIPGLIITNSNSGFAETGAGGNNERRVRASLALADRIDAAGMEAFADHPLNPSVSKRLPAAARAELIEAFGKHDPIGLARMLRSTTANATAVDRVHELTMPTLLTWGVYEKRFAPAVELARDHIANLTVAELQAGHPVNLHDPDGFDRAVMAFIAATPNVASVKARC
ncbi:MAG: alpha/beta fold hydrolase [Acidimicrobiales bacterium]